MSTRSIIGTALDNGFEGRYCHWDGYPTHRGPQLLQTYAQLRETYGGREHAGAVEAVKRWAIRPGALGYWSSYQTPLEHLEAMRGPTESVCDLCFGSGLRPDMADSHKGCNGCSGSGVHKVERSGWLADNGDGWTTAGEDCGAEWAYLLAPEGISVLGSEYDDGSKCVGMFGGLGESFGWRRYALVAWDAQDVNWERIERGLAVAS